jgi:beta-lactamase superfamily II metal-dependent hydrolase
VVVSGGTNFDVRQATATYRDKGAEVFHTAEHGAVSVRIDDQGLRLATVLSPR